MYHFSSRIAIIGINPYVSVPAEILAKIFTKAQKDKGPIPVCGYINGTAYTQTLVRYANEWRLYINTKMLKNSPKRVGEIIEVSIDFDPADRTIPLHPELAKALIHDTHAQQVFDALTPSLRKEINRYISNLKSEAKVHENVRRAVDFLHGRGRFVGRQL